MHCWYQSIVVHSTWIFSRDYYDDSILFGNFLIFFGFSFLFVITGLIWFVTSVQDCFNIRFIPPREFLHLYVHIWFNVVSVFIVVHTTYVWFISLSFWYWQNVEGHLATLIASGISSGIATHKPSDSVLSKMLQSPFATSISVKIEVMLQIRYYIFFMTIFFPQFFNFFFAGRI